MITLEVCSGSIESSIDAQKAGAVRVELCDNLKDGGTTPSQSQIELTRKNIDIQLNVIIRPRGGDFYYTDLEFESMKFDIHNCGKAKCDGVVIGILHKNGTIDKERSRELVEIAQSYGMSVTFHRAFDRCENLSDALEEIIDLGCDRILTSGGKKTAWEGREKIKQLIAQADRRIVIMPGAGITENNIYDLVQATGLKEFHGTFRSLYKGDMQYMSPDFDNAEEEYYTLKTDIEKVRAAIQNANK